MKQGLPPTHSRFVFHSKLCPTLRSVLSPLYSCCVILCRFCTTLQQGCRPHTHPLFLSGDFAGPVPRFVFFQTFATPCEQMLPSPVPRFAFLCRLRPSCQSGMTPPYPRFVFLWRLCLQTGPRTATSSFTQDFAPTRKQGLPPPAPPFVFL